MVSKASCSLYLAWVSCWSKLDWARVFFKSPGMTLPFMLFCYWMAIVWSSLAYLFLPMFMLWMSKSATFFKPRTLLPTARSWIGLYSGLNLSMSFGLKWGYSSLKGLNSGCSANILTFSTSLSFLKLALACFLLSYIICSFWALVFYFLPLIVKASSLSTTLDS